MPEYTLMDPQVLRKSVGDDNVAFLVLGQIFLSSAPPMFAELQAACAAGDLGAARSASHRLRGSTLLLGAQQVTALLLAGEQAALQGQTDAVRRAEQELRPLFPRLLDEVAACMAANGAGPA